MNKIYHSTLLRCFILIVITSSCTKDDFLPVPKEVTILKYHSNEVNDDYLIYIRLPKEYDSVLDSFPVLYQLDGDTSTGDLIKNTTNLLESNRIRDFIIVAIDYENKNERVRDYTPTALSDFENSGGAAAFYQFLQNELIPFIDTNYRTDSDLGNTIRGHSLGGLFASYAMFSSQETMPLFKGYIIESPSWWWDNNYSFGQEHSYSSENTSLPIKGYFSIGELESATIKAPFDIMKDKLLSRQYSGFEPSFEILDNFTHLDVRDNANGILQIFKR